MTAEFLLTLMREEQVRCVCLIILEPLQRIFATLTVPLCTLNVSTFERHSQASDNLGLVGGKR